MCSSADTRATVRPTGFHQNAVAGFPRPTRHSSWSPAVKFAPCEPYAESQVLQRFEADATLESPAVCSAIRYGPMSSLLPLFLYSLVNQVERAGKGRGMKEKLRSLRSLHDCN